MCTCIGGGGVSQWGIDKNTAGVYYHVVLECCSEKRKCIYNGSSLQIRLGVEQAVH